MFEIDKIIHPMQDLALSLADPPLSSNLENTLAKLQAGHTTVSDTVRSVIEIVGSGSAASQAPGSAGSGTISFDDNSGLFTVSGSPASLGGAISVVYAPQSANMVLAGPVSGSAAAMAVRSLVTADLPGAIVSTTFSGVTATIGSLTVTTATIGTGSIATLVSPAATITTVTAANLVATAALITTATIVNANIAAVVAPTISVTTLIATTATIATLTAPVITNTTLTSATATVSSLLTAPVISNTTLNSVTATVSTLLTAPVITNTTLTSATATVSSLLTAPVISNTTLNSNNVGVGTVANPLGAGSLWVHTATNENLGVYNSGGLFIQALNDANDATVDLNISCTTLNLASTTNLQINGTNGVSAGNFTAVTSITTIHGIVTTLSGTSDERLKDAELYEGGLGAILAISPVRYRWNAKGQAQTGLSGDQEFVGFIAQDVQRAIPEAITATEPSKDGTETYLSLDDRPIICALVNAVKELSTMNTALVARIEALEGKHIQVAVGE